MLVGVYVGVPGVLVLVISPLCVTELLFVLEIDTDVVKVGVPGVLLDVIRELVVLLGISVGVKLKVCVKDVVFEDNCDADLLIKLDPVTQTVAV
jgi:hypothetical protein